MPAFRDSRTARKAVRLIRSLGGPAAVLLLVLALPALTAAAAMPVAALPALTAPGSAAAPGSYDLLPSIPGWAVHDPAPVMPSGTVTDGQSAAARDRTQYQTLVQFPVTSEVFCAGPDDSPTLTYFYTGDYSANNVTRHVVDVNLNHTAVPLPITYGQSWLAADLDRDGNVELILQRGDSGMGGNGYLDIVSAPNWTLRAHITLAGMKVYFYPVAINVDADPYLELYLTPSSLGGTARAMLVDYNPATGGFVVASDIPAPTGTGGATAAGDFDGDGHVEFITGSSSGYNLFECVNDTLSPRGLVALNFVGNFATALRPMPDGALYALLGNSSFSDGFRYELLRPTGDNTFLLVHLFQEITSWSGITPSYGLDADLDGLDEIVMDFYPAARIYGWDPEAQDFLPVWSWDQQQIGTLEEWAKSDIDRDGVPEWCSVNHLDQLLAFEDQDAPTTAVFDPEADPSTARLVAAPNPFVTGTRLTLQTPTTGALRPVELLDAGGRVVRHWTLSAGAALEWNGRDAQDRPVPAGVYYLRANGLTDARSRLIRLR